MEGPALGLKVKLCMRWGEAALLQHVGKALEIC